jgi:hypothetical protein
MNFLSKLLKKGFFTENLWHRIKWILCSRYERKRKDQINLVNRKTVRKKEKIKLIKFKFIQIFKSSKY